MPRPDDPDDFTEEELALGPHRPWSGNLRSRFGWRWRAVAAIVLIAAAVTIPLATTSTSPKTPAARHFPHRPLARAPSTVAPPRAPKPYVVQIPRFALGIHGRWELFGRSDSSMVRIQFARGRVTTTQVPGLASSGPVYFVAGLRAALIHPLDFVPSYVVPDGRATRAAPARLSCGGPALPSPDADAVWVPACSGHAHLLYLTILNGERGHLTLSLPRSTVLISALPDGQGFGFVPGYAQASLPSFDVRPGEVTRVSRGPVLAVGPTRWLLGRCPHGRCRGIVVNRATGVRRRLSAPVPPQSVPGVISPNGGAAALVTPKTKVLALIDLRTGAQRPVQVPVDYTDLQTMVWSPDSRWLFGIGYGGELWAVNYATGHVYRNLTLDLHIPFLHQLAIRAAPATS
jgi:hypothetical protein